MLPIIHRHPLLSLKVVMEVETMRRAKDETEGRLELALSEIVMLRRAKGDMEKVDEAS